MVTWNGNHVSTIDYYQQYNPSSASNQAYQQLTYIYEPGSNANAGSIASIVTQGWNDATSSMQNVSQVTYTYYDTTSANGGLLGDLRSACAQQWDCDTSSWNAGNTTLYRYYTTVSSTGFVHGLERVLLPVVYAAACSNFGIAAGDPNGFDNISDSDIVGGKTLANFTCYYFEYNPSDLRVTEETKFGLSSTYSLSVTYNTSGTYVDGYDNWQREVTETDPDGATTIEFENFLGQPILTELESGASQQITYSRYYDDSSGPSDPCNGKLLWQAQPSAFTLYNGQYYDPALLDLIGYTGGNSLNGTSQYLSAISGLVDVNAYYGSNTANSATPGGAAGYLQASGVQMGTSAAPVWQTSENYETNPAGTGPTVYYTCESTEYPTAPPSGTTPTPATPVANSETTTQQETFFTATTDNPGPTIATQTTSLPVVSPTQNGSGNANVSEDVYNSLDRVVWSKDARGVITYSQYDAAGNMTEQIQDANVNESESATSLDRPVSDGRWDLLPPAWKTSGATYQNVITSYAYDSHSQLREPSARSTRWRASPLTPSLGPSTTRPNRRPFPPRARPH